MKTIALFFLFCFASVLPAETINGRVIRIADGDTLTILDASNVQYKIRFAGIDAPEKDQPFGAASKNNLSKLTAGKNAEAFCPKRDRYKRYICISSSALPQMLRRMRIISFIDQGAVIKKVLQHLGLWEESQAPPHAEPPKRELTFDPSYSQLI